MALNLTPPAPASSPVPTDIGDTIAWALSGAILIGSCFVKVPQILSIVRSRSVDGLSEVSAAIDAISSLIFCYYNLLRHYPFGTWGEVALSALQASWVLLLFWLYRPSLNLPLRLGGVIAWGAFSCVVLQVGTYSETVAQFLGNSPTVLTLFSRLPQLILNIQQGHTGQLSGITYLLQFLGNCARLITTVQLLGSDAPTLVAHFIVGLLNLGIFLQIIHYGPATRQALARSAGQYATNVVSLKRT